MSNDTPDTTPGRPPYRPPIGLPLERQSRLGAAAAVLLHVLGVTLLFAPALVTPAANLPLSAGAGGEGPAGGGGGGRRGTGGLQFAREQLQYMQVAPEPEPVVAPVPPPEEPVIVPEVPPPVPVQEAPVPETGTAETAVDVAATVGSGGGSGTDGSRGDGPGSGGGVGSGIGTGRGSGVGPGTGGGTDAIHPPMPVQFFLPPLPAPERIKPYRMIAVFDVDETGNVISFEFNESRDRGYNRRLREVLSEIRFRPAVTPDGRPVRARAIVSYDL
jgi:periplasmic protein TonB